MNNVKHDTFQTFYLWLLEINYKCIYLDDLK